MKGELELEIEEMTEALVMTHTDVYMGALRQLLSSLETADSADQNEDERELSRMLKGWGKVMYDFLNAGYAECMFKDGWLGLWDYEREWRDMWIKKDFQGLSVKFMAECTTRVNNALAAEDGELPLYLQDSLPDDDMIERAARMKEFETFLEVISDDDKRGLVMWYFLWFRDHCFDYDTYMKWLKEERHPMEKKGIETVAVETLEGLFGEDCAEKIRSLGYVEVTKVEGKIRLKWLPGVVVDENGVETVQATREWAYFCKKLLDCMPEDKKKNKNKKKKMTRPQLSLRFGYDKDKLKHVMWENQHGETENAEAVNNWAKVEGLTKIEDEIRKVFMNRT